MTIGQRIAQKRKELGLSQEGLGEQLGVSRQAIYKWESDASLPEIDKLVTLSRIFSVSVGWLLGVEETPAPPEAAPAAGELTEQQLAMVQQIVERYLAAQPRRPAWDRWSARILFVLCGVMLALLAGLNSRIKDMGRDYTYLSGTVDSIEHSVDNKINSVTSWLERSLEKQADLTTDWSAEVASTDPKANTVTFDIRVVPKVYTDGMTARFMAHSGGKTVEVPAQSAAEHSFSGQITCPLSDDISLSVILLANGTGDIQRLRDFQDLYAQSFPELTVRAAWHRGSRSNILLPMDHGFAASISSGDKDYWTPEPPAAVQVGLFCDRKLVMWYEPGVRYLDAIDREASGWNLPEQVELEPGCEYCAAAVYTDEYGRQRVYLGPFFIASASSSAPAAALTPGWGNAPDGWEF